MSKELSRKFCPVVAVELMKNRSHVIILYSLFTIQGHEDGTCAMHCYTPTRHVNAYAYSCTI
jgi:hypothetical protein